MIFDRRCDCKMHGYLMTKGKGIYCVACNKFYGLQHQQPDIVDFAIAKLFSGCKIELNTLKVIP